MPKLNFKFINILNYVVSNFLKLRYSEKQKFVDFNLQCD